MKMLTYTQRALALLSATAIFVTGCDNKQTPAGGTPPPPKEVTPAIVSAEKNSFNEVTSKLDPGGSFYLYLSTEQFLAKLSNGVGALSNLVGKLPNQDANAREGFAKAMTVAASIVNESGVTEISGVGMSSIAREKGFYYNKFIVHHYKGQNSGPLWELFGKSAHHFDLLDYLPADTALAGSFDLDVPLVWENIKSVVHELNIPDASAQLDSFPAMFQKDTGLDLDAALKSLGGEFGAVLTLDEQKQVRVPMGAHPVELPNPALCLVFKVKSDLIFDRIEKVLMANPMLSKMVMKTDEAGLKMRTVMIPLPIEVEVHPTIARVGDYLLIASTDTLIRNMIATKKGEKKGFVASEAFKKLSQGVPLEGNNFSLATKALGHAFSRVQEQSLEATHTDSETIKALHDMMETNVGAGMFNVGANGPEGWEAVGNGGTEGGAMLLLPAIAGVGAASAIALPAFARAKQKAQGISCINNLRIIEAAKQQWALENKKSGSDTPTMEDLKPFVGEGASGEFPKCPDGGTYTIGAVNEKPTCSIAKHKLP